MHSNRRLIKLNNKLNESSNESIHIFCQKILIYDLQNEKIIPMKHLVNALISI